MYSRQQFNLKSVSVDDIIKKDKEMRKKTGGKSLRDMLREAEQERRELEEQRRKASELGQTQQRQVSTLTEKMRNLKVEGAEWKREYEQFTPEEEAERRQIVAQQVMESDGDVDDLIMYRYYVSASQIIIGRRFNY
eukprot:TRINITY_DN66132_c4_g2_i1.p2 TRINITY_DN66132_c4_g2~~TRINITY_DN66132_c4_g2_i1.p2  ORF type:complete len:136 (+),score=26.04 TRINITY_DN66132_c4_g2_i1:352-759(+)